METMVLWLAENQELIFKSHHSGMETSQEIFRRVMAAEL